MLCSLIVLFLDNSWATVALIHQMQKFWHVREGKKKKKRSLSSPMPRLARVWAGDRDHKKGEI